MFILISTSHWFQYVNAQVVLWLQLLLAWNDPLCLTSSWSLWYLPVELLGNCFQEVVCVEVHSLLNIGKSMYTSCKILGHLPPIHTFDASLFQVQCEPVHERETGNWNWPNWFRYSMCSELMGTALVNRILQFIFIAITTFHMNATKDLRHLRVWQQRRFNIVVF